MQGGSAFVGQMHGKGRFRVYSAMCPAGEWEGQAPGCRQEV